MLQRLITSISNLNTLYIGTLLFLVTFFCYANTLGNGLFFDDEQFIYNNQVVKTFDIPGLLGNSLVSGGGKLSNYYRPVLFTGFAAEYHLFRDNGFIYHFDSMLIHFLAGLLLYLLVKKIFNKKLLALLTSLLFLIHPVQTEAIAYASGRGDPLSFFFVMLTILLSLNKATKYRLLSLACLIAALLSKEIALMTPGLIFLVHLFKEKSFSKSALKNSVIATIPFVIVTVIYFLLRLSVLNFSNTLNFYNQTNIYTNSLFIRLNTFFHLFPSYIQLLLLPTNLFMERDSGIKIQILPTIQSVGAILALLIIGIGSFMKKKSLPIFLFGFIWIAITFIPTSGIIPINGIFYEHFLYYPSVGFFLIVSFLLISLYQRVKPWAKAIIILGIFLTLLTLSIRTIARNSEWHDPIIFYKQTLSHVQSPRAYNNLAMAYADAGENKEAIKAYKKAINLGDTYPESHFNLANTYIANNDLTAAEKEYKKALLIDPEFYLAYGSLYRIYKTTNNTVGLKAITSALMNLSKKNPGYAEYLKQLQVQK